MDGSAPNKTTFLGGLGLALVALIQLTPLVCSWFPASPLFVVNNVPIQIVVPLLLLASCVILAFGYRREQGIVGSSVLGRVGFLLLGLGVPIQLTFSYLLFSAGGVGSSAAVWVGTTLEVLTAVATAIAAVAVVRAHILTGFARWILVGVATAELMQFALSIVPNATQAYYIAVLFYVAAVPLLLLLSAGVSFALEGRTASIRQRLQVIYAKW
jgi:hypothetical protein